MCVLKIFNNKLCEVLLKQRKKKKSIYFRMKTKDQIQKLYKNIHILLIQFIQFEIICLSYVIAIILACYKIVQLRTMINVERLLSLY